MQSLENLEDVFGKTLFQDILIDSLFFQNNFKKISTTGITEWYSIIVTIEMLSIGEPGQKFHLLMNEAQWVGDSYPYSLPAVKFATAAGPPLLLWLQDSKASAQA